MKEIWNCPKVLLFRLVKILTAGLICFVFGMIWSLTMQMHDWLLLVLSSLILLFSIYHSFLLLQIIRKELYDMVQGECISVEKNRFNHFCRIWIQNPNGTETLLRLDNRVRFIKGRTYRLYFRTDNEKVLSTESYLAMEDWGLGGIEEG